MKKDTINIVKRQITDWEKISDLCTMDKALQSILTM